MSSDKKEMFRDWVQKKYSDAYSHGFFSPFHCEVDWTWHLADEKDGEETLGKEDEGNND